MILTPTPGRNSTVRRLARARELLHSALDEKLMLDRVAREAALSQ